MFERKETSFHHNIPLVDVPSGLKFEVTAGQNIIPDFSTDGFLFQSN